ncbi:MAG: hypothetical protein ACREYA_05670 [Cupriavidus necator]
MLPGVFTSEELAREIGADNRIGRRRFKVPLNAALDAAHATPFGHAQYAQHLFALSAACDDWLIRHQGSKFKRRCEGVTKLKKQVEKLLLPIRQTRQEIGASMASRRARFRHTAGLSEAARAEQIRSLLGPGEANDPRTIKSRAAFHQERLDATIQRALALHHVENDFNTEQLGYLGAHRALEVDAVLDEAVRDRCRVEAMRVLCAMLGKNRHFAQQFARQQIKVVVVPADRPMTDLPQFGSLNNVAISQPGSAVTRYWNETRGVGGLAIGNVIYVAVTEENLLGTPVTGAALAAHGGCYAPGYSTTSHEFAHALHRRGILEWSQRQTITDAFRAATCGVRLTTLQGQQAIVVPATETRNSLALANFLDTVFARPFVDGPRHKAGPGPKSYRVFREGNLVTYHAWYSSAVELQDCYAAFDEKEYFAQCVNCYLGTNSGVDPYTAQRRNDGAAWVRRNEPAPFVRLLDTLFSEGAGHAPSVLPRANTVEPVTLTTTVKDIIAERVTRRLFAELPGIDAGDI